jgi:2-polyprenyl-3-methyl-5-hydroxy-6-metoxy-1,4-benzoquinol methylase
MIPLQAYNYARVNYMRSFFDLKAKPFENMEILDIGCGGGLLSESLNRLGAKVTAIDATFES